MVLIMEESEALNLMMDHDLAELKRFHWTCVDVQRIREVLNFGFVKFANKSSVGRRELFTTKVVRLPGGVGGSEDPQHAGKLR